MNEYDKVLLKDGSIATIVEVVDDEKAFVAEVERKDSIDGIEIEPVLMEEIEKVL